MAQRDFVNSVDGAVTISPAVYTADTTGTGIDLQGVSAVALILSTGAYTDGTHDFSLEESDDNSTFTAVSSDQQINTFPTVDAAGDADSVFRVGYIGNKRYVRVVTTTSGTTSGAAYGVTAVKHDLHREPIDYTVTA